MELSIVGCTYHNLLKEHLIGKFLSKPEIKKTKQIIIIDDLQNWEKEIKPYEYDFLFYIAHVLIEIDQKSLAADMLLFAYVKGKNDNFIISNVRDPIINKETILQSIDEIYN